MMHSDQGAQFSLKEFTEFCKSKRIVQSMSKASYPYDNAPMERYFNTLKKELLNLHTYHTHSNLNLAIEEFAYCVNWKRIYSARRR